MDETQIRYHEHEVANVVEVIMNMSNPFEVEDSMVDIASGKVAPANVSTDMISAKDIATIMDKSVNKIDRHFRKIQSNNFI
jgi:hypothetical protein